MASEVLKRTNQKNLVLENQYKGKAFTKSYPEDKTLVVELTIRRHTMSEAAFVSLGSKMNENQVINYIFDEVKSLQFGDVFVDTYTTKNHCSPPSSTINVLFVFSESIQKTFGIIAEWLRDDFQKFLIKLFATQKYTVNNNGQPLKTFQIRA